MTQIPVRDENDDPTPDYTDPQPDTPVAAQETDNQAVPAGRPVPDQDGQEADNPDASHKPGEAQGRATAEIKAAERHPDTAERTNPVAEATGSESKDPYAEGKHIANPEPDNGAGQDDTDDGITDEELDGHLTAGASEPDPADDLDAAELDEPRTGQ